MMDGVPRSETGEPKFDIMSAGDVELLMLTIHYLEGVRAHPRMIGAVKRAALRLLDARDGNGQEIK